jgi:hypothetical protein
MRQTGSSFSQASQSALDVQNLYHPSEKYQRVKCTNNHKLQNKETNILAECLKGEFSTYLKMQCKASSSWNKLLRIRLLRYGIWASIYLSFPNILFIGFWTLGWDNHLQTTKNIYINFQEKNLKQSTISSSLLFKFKCIPDQQLEKQNKTPHQIDQLSCCHHQHPYYPFEWNTFVSTQDT